MFKKKRNLENKFHSINWKIKNLELKKKNSRKQFKSKKVDLYNRLWSKKAIKRKNYNKKEQKKLRELNYRRNKNSQKKILSSFKKISKKKIGNQ